MSGLFGGTPKIPDAPPPVPMVDEERIRKARERALRMRQQNSGRASTLLSRPDNMPKLGG